jgi:hypothetical protein
VWKKQGARQIIYAKASLTVREQIKAARQLGL